MAQQTAVEWLVEQLPQIDWDDPYYVGLLQEANKIFEDQIKDAWDKRVFRGTFVKGWHIETQNGEEYYNQTYNK